MDGPIHGAIHQTPIVRLIATSAQRYGRRVAHVALVRVDTVHYSAPHRLAPDHVDVLVDEQVVPTVHGATVVATNARWFSRLPA